MRASAGDKVGQGMAFADPWLLSHILRDSRHAVVGKHEVTTYLDGLFVALFQLFEIPQLQPLCPAPLVQVQQHALFRLGLAIVNSQTCLSAAP